MFWRDSGVEKRHLGRKWGYQGKVMSWMDWRSIFPKNPIFNPKSSFFTKESIQNINYPKRSILYLKAPFWTKTTLFYPQILSEHQFSLKTTPTFLQDIIFFLPKKSLRDINFPEHNYCLSKIPIMQSVDKVWSRFSDTRVLGLRFPVTPLTHSFYLLALFLPYISSVGLLGNPTSLNPTLLFRKLIFP